MIADKDIMPGSEGRPAGCLYFNEDHERAAALVRANAPEIFTAMREHSGDGPLFSVEAFRRFSGLVRQVLPMARLMDETKVSTILLGQAQPLSEQEQWVLKDMERRSADWQERVDANLAAKRRDH